MAVADAASVRTVAVQLRSLSADEENQPIIAREDGCLRALISFISGDDIDMDVASVAVAALKNLASHPDNYELLRAEDELVDGLKDLLLADEAELDLRRDIFDIIEELTDEDDEDELDELDELEKKAALVEPDEPASALDDPSLLPDPVTTRLHIPNLSDDVFCMRVEQLVIRKPGVISLVFEIGAEIAVIYGRVPPEDLCSFVGTMTGVQVEVLPPEPESEEEDEEEEAAGEGASAGVGVGTDAGEDGAEKENAGPGYLDQTGQRFKDVAKKNAKKKNNVSQGASSLAARLAAQREEESRKKARANRLTEAIGNGYKSGWGLW